jgi:hypothetical protein
MFGYELNFPKNPAFFPKKMYIIPNMNLNIGKKAKEWLTELATEAPNFCCAYLHARARIMHAPPPPRINVQHFLACKSLYIKLCATVMGKIES